MNGYTLYETPAFGGLTLSVVSDQINIQYSVLGNTYNICSVNERVTKVPTLNGANVIDDYICGLDAFFPVGRGGVLKGEYIWTKYGITNQVNIKDGAIYEINVYDSYGNAVCFSDDLAGTIVADITVNHAKPKRVLFDTTVSTPTLLFIVSILTETFSSPLTRTEQPVDKPHCHKIEAKHYRI